MNELTYEKAICIAKNHLKDIDKEKINFVILEDDTLEIHDGWVFFFQSKDYMETGDSMYLLAGNAPFLVNKFNSKVITFGTAMNVDYYISEYENGNLN